MSAPPHAAFLEDLQNGHTIEMWVAIRLLEAGLTVKLGELDKAETPFEAERFTEETDVLVNGVHILEVKSSSYQFTSPDDWPFAGAYTCTVKRWEARAQKPLAFVIVSVPTQAILVVSSKTAPTWEVVSSKDQRREGWETDTYRAPKEALVPFERLLQFLRSGT